MQPHEGPRPDPERGRQRRLTLLLIGVIGALTAAVIFTLVGRWK